MSITKIIFFIVLAVAFIAGGMWYNGVLDQVAAKQALVEEEKMRQEELKATASIQIADLIVGKGAEVKKGDVLSVHYLGELADGEKFDSSYDRKEPFEFTLGAKEVIRGWDLGIPGMKVGGKRMLVVPPELAYGDKEYGPIPASSTLKFTIELLSVNGSTSTIK